MRVLMVIDGDPDEQNSVTMRIWRDPESWMQPREEPEAEAIVPSAFLRLMENQLMPTLSQVVVHVKDDTL